MRTYAQFLQGEACWRLTRLGRLDETEAIVERVLAEGAQGRRRGRPATTTPPISPCAAAGSTSAAEHFERARELLGGTSDSMWIGNQAAARPRPRSGRADPERAWQLATGALDFVPEDQYAHYTDAPARDRAARRRRPRAARAGARRRATAPAEAQRDARAIFASLRALLAPERWHDGAPAPSRPPSTR